MRIVKLDMLIFDRLSKRRLPRRICVGCDPDTYLFFDFVHPTTYGYGLIAEFAAEATVDHYSQERGKAMDPER